ncbi:MAG: hypothetical protein FJW20_09885 [Acidimicrobiia bacterium]|nr:hypothetical protein [Acidimicrobiia bacterium]
MKRALILVLAAAPLLAQPYAFRKHYISAGGGGGVPANDLSPFFSASPVVGFHYGYRFHEYFQIDAGFDAVFHAAKVRDFFQSEIGDLRIRDFQYMVPLGGRAILPIASNRVLLSFGGGAAYLRYQESIRQPFGDSGFRFECPVCRSRSGWGYYGLIGGSVALDRAQHFRLGVTTRLYRADTTGDAFGLLPPVRSSDSWVNTAAEFTFSF